MTQLTNDYIYEIIGNQQIPYGEDIMIPAGAGTTQQTGYPVKGQSHRIMNVGTGTASAALVMKSILSLDNPQLVILINDSTQTVVVFPFKAFGVGAIDTAETINGGASLSIPTLTSAVFWSSVVQTKRKGGPTVNTLNWSAATFS